MSVAHMLISLTLIILLTRGPHLAAARVHAGDEQLAGVDLALDLAVQIARDLFHSNQSNEPRRLVVVSRAGRHGAEHTLKNGGGGLGL